MNKTSIINVVKKGAVVLKPYALPVLTGVVTAVAGVMTEQKAEARLVGMENKIKELESLLNK